MHFLLIFMMKRDYVHHGMSDLMIYKEKTITYGIQGRIDKLKMEVPTIFHNSKALILKQSVQTLVVPPLRIRHLNCVS